MNQKPNSLPSASSADLTAEDITLEAVELLFALEDNAKRRKQLEEIGKVLKERRGSSGEQLAQGSVLPKSARNPYFSYFHANLIESSDDDPSNLFFHLGYRIKPSSPAPKILTERRENGFTLEWLTQQMHDLIGREETYFYVNLEAELRREVELKAAVMAPPLTPGSNLLRCSGIEYSTKEEDLTEGVYGVRKFRWSKKSNNHLRIWIDYDYLSSTLSTKPWTQEINRCVTHLHQLL